MGTASSKTRDSTPPEIVHKLFSVNCQDYPGVPATAAPPKLKAFVGLTATYYLRKDAFAAGAFGRTYACLDSNGRAWAAKEVRLTRPSNPAKGFTSRSPIRTRYPTTPSDFGSELGTLSMCDLMHEAVEFFQNKKGSKGYAVLRLMTGSGQHLMGDRSSPGLLPWAFAAARADTHGVRDGAIYRDLLRRLARHGRDIHAANILLSDIKPDNILFRNAHVEFSDFGTAARGPEAEYKGGTQTYRAPESFKTGLIRPACDVYSMGITLAEWILGKHPLRLGPGLLDYMDPKNLADYLAGEPCPHAALLDGRFRRIEQVDPELGQLVRRMTGEEGGRPSFAEVVASPALALSPCERQVMDAAWTSLPRRRPAVWRRLWELDAEIDRLGLPYRRDDRTWQP